MLNITDLEKRWFKYKIKSFMPYIVLLSLLIIIVISYFLFALSTEEKKDANSSLKNNIIKKQTIPEKKRQTITANKHSSKQKDVHISTDNNISARVLSPSMDFMTTFTQKSPYIQKQEQIPQHKKIVQKKKKNNIQRLPHKQKKVEVIAVPHITIVKQNTAHDIKNILSRFQKDKNPALSLFLAKKYYELKDYEKASQYALITNQLNSNIEDSWIIFAKTLVKTHHKQKAINVLTKYIRSSHSTNAALLLHSIRTGEFK